MDSAWSLTLAVLVVITSGRSDGTVQYNVSYVGCFDIVHSLFSDYHKFNYEANLEKCYQQCHSPDNRYIGVEQSDNYCYCGNDIVEKSEKVSDSSCDVHCNDNPQLICGGYQLMSVYLDQSHVIVSGEEEPSFHAQDHSDLQYEGCFGLRPSLLRNYHNYTESTTLEKCHQQCREKNTRYVGVEESDDFCYCGNNIPQLSGNVSDTLCNRPCPDNPQLTCGGSSLMSVYRRKAYASELPETTVATPLTSIFTTTPTTSATKEIPSTSTTETSPGRSDGTVQYNVSYVGCFDLTHSLISDYHKFIYEANLNKCYLHCSSPNNRYIGVEQSDHFCYCGNDIVEKSEKVSDSRCNVHCSDNTQLTCGGYQLMSVYLHEPHVNISGEEQPTFHAPDHPDLQYEGCFGLTPSLLRNYHNYTESTTLGKCHQQCREKNTRYVGVEESDDFCYCGNDIPQLSRNVSDTLCNRTCPDNPQLTCGGISLMSVYRRKAYASELPETTVATPLTSIFTTTPTTSATKEIPSTSTTKTPPSINFTRIHRMQAVNEDQTVQTKVSNTKFIYLANFLIIGLLLVVLYFVVKIYQSKQIFTSRSSDEAELTILY